MIIAVDASTTRTGIVKFEDSGKIISTFAITPNDKLHPYLKIKYVVDELRKHIKECNECIQEGIFLNTYASGKHGVEGFETLARLGGAIVNEWLNNHTNLPMILKANQARPLAGVNAHSHKADIQIFIAEKFKLATEEQIDEFRGLVYAERGALLAEEFTKETFKKHMNVISKHIEDIIGLTEDVADAYVLYIAFMSKKGIKI
jgi:hypothetical protein